MFEIRGIPEHELDRMLDLADLVFHDRTDDEDRDDGRWMARRAERIGAYSGDTLIGQLAALPMRLSVPGACLDCSAITFVGVLPTHRRRGVLTAMIDRMHADAVAAHRPLAALWASQAGIYGRYGFGQANRAIGVEVDTTRPLALRIDPDPRPLRLVDRAEAASAVGPLYGRALARRAGGLVRDAEWWSHVIVPEEDPEEDDLTEPRIAVIDGDPGGYVIYRTRGGDDYAQRPGVVRVYDLEGDTPEIEAALWRYLADIDLTGRIQAWNRPVDDLIPLLAADPDQVAVNRTWGALWLRLIDVPTALRGRSWAAADDLVIEIKDGRLPANAGRWRLTTGHDARCDRTDDSPDLAIDAAELAAVYLGDTRVRDLARARLITEHTAGAADRLDAALAVPLAPHTVDDF